MDERERILALEKDMEYLKDDIKDIKNTLNRMEKKMDKHMEELAFMKAKVGVISFFVGAVVSALVSLFLKLFSHGGK